jgi:gliding motility-associated-like protein
MIIIMKKILFYICFNIIIVIHLTSQIIITTSSQDNTICNGIDCQYDGPTILINEVMLAPSIGDGSIYGISPYGTNPAEGEWIELYNPDECQSIDISCYFLGNNAVDGGTNLPGGFVLPQGTIVPPQGFCVVRGVNAPAVPSQLLVQNGGKTVEVVVGMHQSRICLGGGWRLWFPNAGGWFAFFDQNGIPQDAISWANQTNSCLACAPCNPNLCSYSGSLPSYDNIPANRKTYITSSLALNFSYSRIPDGGNWGINQATNSTLGTCNSACNPPPTITCNGTASASVSGGIFPYTYKWNDTQSQTTQIATGLCEGTYCVTVTSANNQTVSACVVVNNLSLPITIQSPDNSLCIGETFIFQASQSAGYLYNWSGPNNWTSVNANNQITNVNPNMTGTYTVTVTNTNGCSGTASVNLVVNPHPTIIAEAIPDSVCIGLPVELIASGASNYIWSHGLGNSNYVETYPTQITTYSVTGTDLHGCTGTAQVTVYTVDFIYVELSITPDEICAGDSALLIVTGGEDYVWNYDFGNQSQIWVSPNISTTYSVFSSNNFGCTGSAEISLLVNSIPNALFQFNPHQGCSPLYVSYTNLSDEGTYFWNFGDGNTSVYQHPSHLYSVPGTYQVTLTVTKSDCTNTYYHPESINVYPNPVADFIVSQNVVTVDEGTVNFSNTSVGASTWFWYFDNSSNIISSEQQFSYNFTQEGYFSVCLNVENQWGCKDSTCNQILVKPFVSIYIPNSFSPNNNGINDYFFVSGINIDNEDFSMMIYDRWGSLIFSANKLNDAKWDGRYYSGNKIHNVVPPGTYVYVISAKLDGIKKKYKGIVTVIH